MTFAGLVWIGFGSLQCTTTGTENIVTTNAQTNMIQSLNASLYIQAVAESQMQTFENDCIVFVVH